VLKKVKEKVNKIKQTLAGHSHGHSDNDGDETVRVDYGGRSGDEEGEGDAALEREATMEMGGYMEDVEDKSIASEPEPEPQVHNASSKCFFAVLLILFSRTIFCDASNSRVSCLHGMVCVARCSVRVGEDTDSVGLHCQARPG
jgi:hypothetical protein